MGESEEGSDSDSSGSWNTDEENYEDERDPRRGSFAQQRQLRRFQNLNEFELSQQEKQGFAQCQKQHNSLIAGIDVTLTVGVDLFEENIWKSWRAAQRSKKKN